jgi:hypothetical protein
MPTNPQSSRDPGAWWKPAGVWRPILDGAQSERAVQTVQVVADVLRAPPSPPGRANFSVAGGSAGLAIFFGYLEQVFPGIAEPAMVFLEEAIAAASDGPTPPSLYSGLTGVGWAAAHLQEQRAGLDTGDVAAEIDQVLYEHLNAPHWPADYDLIDGLVGFGVYALERLPVPSAVACVERVIGHLAGTAEHRPEGVTWWTNPDWLMPEMRQQSPQGYYNLGVAHGVPGVIALLGCACAAGVAVEQAQPLLDGAVRWLLAQVSEGAAATGLPFAVGPGIPAGPARLAWCYGDLGVAVALLSAARSVGEPEWERAALTIARRAADRPVADSGVVDAGLCHGAAGVGHLFNRLFQATGEEHFAEAARSWFERALAMREPGHGIAGYLSWAPGGDGAMTWLADGGLLTGAAGIGLALLAAATPIEPAWDRMLLVSVAPQVVGAGSGGTHERAHTPG